VRSGRSAVDLTAARPGRLPAGLATQPAHRRHAGRGDPLDGMSIGEQVGLVAIEFAAYRRVCVNGLLTGVGRGWLEIEVDQAYGNCP